MIESKIMALYPPSSRVFYIIVASYGRMGGNVGQRRGTGSGEDAGVRFPAATVSAGVDGFVTGKVFSFDRERRKSGRRKEVKLSKSRLRTTPTPWVVGAVRR